MAFWPPWLPSHARQWEPRWRAIEHYERALTIAREIGDRRAEGIRLGNLGNAYHKLGLAEQAIEYYERALSIAREIGHPDAEPDAEHVAQIQARL